MLKDRFSDGSVRGRFPLGGIDPQSFTFSSSLQTPGLNGATRGQLPKLVDIMATDEKTTSFWIGLEIRHGGPESTA